MGCLFQFPSPWKCPHLNSLGFEAKTTSSHLLPEVPLGGLQVWGLSVPLSLGTGSRSLLWAPPRCPHMPPGSSHVPLAPGSLGADGPTGIFWTSRPWGLTLVPRPLRLLRSHWLGSLPRLLFFTFREGGCSSSVAQLNFWAILSVVV